MARELRGIRVIEVGGAVSVPVAGMLMGSWGAEVILYKLAATSDVFLNNLRPYEMEKFRLTYGEHGPIKVLNNPIKLSETKAEITRAAPKLGEHTEEILKGLGYTDSDIQALKASGAIG